MGNCEAKESFQNSVKSELAPQSGQNDHNMIPMKSEPNTNTDNSDNNYPILCPPAKFENNEITMKRNSNPEIDNDQPVNSSERRLSYKKHNLTIATRIDETSKAKSKYFSPPKKPQKQLQKEEEIPHKMLEAKVPNVLKNGQSYINTLKDTPSVLLRKVKEIIPSVILESEEENHVLYQGALLKYKPGLHFNWIERWCVITKKEFRYYKSEWMAKCPDLQPLVIVPIHDIVATYRVNLELPVYQNKNGLTKNNQKDFGELFQFEIFNSNGDFPYNETFIRELGDKGTQKLNTVNIDDNEGFRLWTQHEEYRRTHRHSDNQTRKGWLMRSPVAVKSPRTGGFESTIQSARAYMEASHGSPLKSPKDRFLETGRTTNSRVSGNLDEGKTVYKWNKEKADLISWSGRQKEWYFSEKRLLFATPSQVEREKWITVLNWINNESHL